MARGLERIELGCKNGNCGRRADRETSSKDGFCVKDRARTGKVDEKKLNVVGLRRADAWKRRRAPATVGVRMPRGMAAESSLEWMGGRRWPRYYSGRDRKIHTLPCGDDCHVDCCKIPDDEDEDEYSTTRLV